MGKEKKSGVFCFYGGKEFRGERAGWSLVLWLHFHALHIICRFKNQIHSQSV